MAGLCILRALSLGQRVVFVTPLRAFSAQTERSLRRTFVPLGCSVSALYGSSGATGDDLDSLANRDVVVSTPEKLDFAFRNEPTGWGKPIVAVQLSWDNRESVIRGSPEHLGGATFSPRNDSLDPSLLLGCRHVHQQKPVLRDNRGIQNRRWPQVGVAPSTSTAGRNDGLGSRVGSASGGSGYPPDRRF